MYFFLFISRFSFFFFRYGVGWTNSDFKIHSLLRKSAHFVAEAKPIVPFFVGREDKVALALLNAVENHFFRRCVDCVVDIESAASLYLLATTAQ